MPLVSIVIPVYYNEASLPALVERLNTLSLQNKEFSFEFIFVDDGSGDNSFAVLCDLAKLDSRIRVIKLARNFGSNTAIIAGLSHARGDCAGFIAADLQEPPEALGEMIGLWKAGKPVVLAVRKDRGGDPVFTRLFAYFFNYLFETFVFKGFTPQGVGFFLVDRRVCDVLVRCEEKNAHLIGLILWTGFPFVTVEYERQQREHGKSRWTFYRKVKFFIDAFTAFTYLPLRIASFLGIICAGMGGVYAVIVLLARLLNEVPVEGWTALMIVILVLSGAQLILLGVIGEYLWRNFDATRKRPLFVVDCEINARVGEGVSDKK